MCQILTTKTSTEVGRSGWVLEVGVKGGVHIRREVYRVHGVVVLLGLEVEGKHVRGHRGCGKCAREDGMVYDLLASDGTN